MNFPIAKVNGHR